MKIILTADVANLGAPGDIVEVKDGYGRNYLLPRKMAIVATRGAEKQVDTIRRAQRARQIRDLDHAKEVAGEPTLDKRAVEVPGQIKTVGTHPVTVRLHPEVTTQVEIAVVAS